MDAKLIIFDECNVQFKDLLPEHRRELNSKLKFLIPHAIHTPAYKLGRWDGKKSFFTIAGKTYLHFVPEILKYLYERGYKLDLEDHRSKIKIEFDTIDENYWSSIGKTWPSGHRLENQSIELRQDQVQAINEFLKNPQAIEELSTGFGKTITTATLSSIAEKYGRTIVIVPNKSLVVQTESTYKDVGLDVGVYYGDRKELGKTHTICTWQSLSVMEKDWKEGKNEKLKVFVEGIATIMVDEAHTAASDVLEGLLTGIFANCPIRWAFTGTLPKEEYRLKTLLSTIGPVVHSVHSYDLQEKGILSDLDIEILQTRDPIELGTYAEEKNHLLKDNQRIEWLAETIKKIGETGNTLVLVDRIETGEMLNELIEDCAFVQGSMKLVDRSQHYKNINNSENTIVIATYGVASTGIDIPRIFNLVLVEPGKSFTRTVQSIGRSIRIAKDKNHAKVYDICSTAKYSAKQLAERKKIYREKKMPFVLKKIDYKD